MTSRQVREGRKAKGFLTPWHPSRTWREAFQKSRGARNGWRQRKAALPLALVLDVEQNRRAQKYSRGELARRVLWGCVQPFFRFSPRPCFGWRNFLLRCFGAQIGRQVHIYRTVTIVIPWNLEAGEYAAIGDHALIYNLGRVTIGARATLSHRAHLCAGTHDYTKADFPLLRPPIVIQEQSWVCADAFIGPGVTVGAGAIVAARAVVVKDVAPWTIVAGNPAKFIKERVPNGTTTD